MVYAHLIHTQLHAVLTFLSSVPGPSGETALAFVLTGMHADIFVKSEYKTDG